MTSTIPCTPTLLSLLLFTPNLVDPFKWLGRCPRTLSITHCTNHLVQAMNLLSRDTRCSVTLPHPSLSGMPSSHTLALLCRPCHLTPVDLMGPPTYRLPAVPCRPLATDPQDCCIGPFTCSHQNTVILQLTACATFGHLKVIDKLVDSMI